MTHATKLAIWTRGIVATQFDVGYDGRTRWKNGAFSVRNGSVSQFLGVYSGRVNAGSNIGYVRRPAAIEATIAAARARD